MIDKKQTGKWRMMLTERFEADRKVDNDADRLEADRKVDDADRD